MYLSKNYSDNFHVRYVLKLRPKNIYVCFRFAPTLIILLLIVSKMLSNLLENGEKINECNFYI